MDSIVVGGSISGLMHALVLRSLGYDVCVIKSRVEEEMQTRAAGLSLWSYAQKLIASFASDMDIQTIAIPNRTTQIMSGNGLLIAEVPVSDDIRTSSWTTVHSRLRESCETELEGYGTVHFDTGKTVHHISEENGIMRVAYHDELGSEAVLLSGLVIAADGARSFVRSQVLPDVKPKYAGYLAWRGHIPETKAPDELKGALSGHLTFFMMDGGYILTYLTPGENDSIRVGERLIEWCWYDHCDALSTDFAEFMTDNRGKLHNVTVPAEFLRPEVWAVQLTQRKEILPPLWQNVLAWTKSPLLTAVHSFDNTRASFFAGKLLLVGEAYIQIRPHIGASCDISALQSLTLAEVMNGEKTMVEWEAEVAKHAMAKATGSKATGLFGMTGKWPEWHLSPSTG